MYKLFSSSSWFSWFITYFSKWDVKGICISVMLLEKNGKMWFIIPILTIELSSQCYNSFKSYCYPTPLHQFIKDVTPLEKIEGLIYSAGIPFFFLIALYSGLIFISVILLHKKIIVLNRKLRLFVTMGSISVNLLWRYY